MLAWTCTSQVVFFLSFLMRRFQRVVVPWHPCIVWHRQSNPTCMHHSCMHHSCMHHCLPPPRMHITGVVSSRQSTEATRLAAQHMAAAQTALCVQLSVLLHLAPWDAAVSNGAAGNKGLASAQVRDGACAATVMFADATVMCGDARSTSYATHIYRVPSHSILCICASYTCIPASCTSRVPCLPILAYMCPHYPTHPFFFLCPPRMPRCTSCCVPRLLWGSCCRPELAVRMGPLH